MATNRICSVVDCGKPHHVHGYCLAHFRRFKRHGDPLGGRRSRGDAPRECSVDNCVKPAVGRGWCIGHWTRWKRHGDPIGGGPSVSKEHPNECVIPGCGKPHYGRGYCAAHCARLRRHGSPFGGETGTGLPKEFLENVAVPYEADNCLGWPYSKDVKGYGKINIAGRPRFVHRLVCVAANGLPPTSRHQAAHNCGNSSCVNPRHLSWKTQVENEADKIVHGTRLQGSQVPHAKLNEKQVVEIREMALRHSDAEIGRIFSVNTETIRRIRRRERWRHV